MVNTVSGHLDASGLGVTYMHEHIIIADAVMRAHYPGATGWDEAQEIARARKVLTELKNRRGCDTIVDLTVAGLGRDVAMVSKAAAGTGLNVIVATGWYTYNELPFLFHKFDKGAKVDFLAGLLRSDIEKGMDGTAIRPGIIKCATDRHGVTDDVDAVIRACARTNLEFGLPISTHSGTLPPEGAAQSALRNGLDQQRILREEGVDLGSVVIGHCNQNPDLNYLQELMDNGSYIGFDRLGIEAGRAPLYAGVPSRAEQLDNLAALIAKGYSSRIVLSHDNWCFMDLHPSDFISAQRGPEFPYGHIAEAVVPGLLERGVSATSIDQMLIGNPRTIFSHN